VNDPLRTDSYSGRAVSDSLLPHSLAEAVVSTLTHSPESGDPAPSAEFRFAPGALLAGRYRIVAALGKGGMGEVYRADDLVLGAAVALKFLPADVAADSHRLQRFRKEVAAARQVSHRHVCRVYDIAEADGQAFLSMEFITGEDLAGVLRKTGRLPVGMAIDLGRQIAQGLHAVHEEGLIHRDLKPANVMLDGHGRAKLTDFGLVASAEGVSGAEAYAGTPAYQAPEQLTGGTITVRTDVYALGVLLYELLTGRRPFEAPTRDEQLRRQKAPPVKPSELVAGVPPEVDGVVLRCLAPEPKDRPGSAHEVWRTLPGDDALHVLLAAGVTPPAQVVADSGGEGRIGRRTALILLTVGILGALATCVLHDRRQILRTTPVESPAELTAAARAVLLQVGDGGLPVTSASGFEQDADQLMWRNQYDRGMDRLDTLAVGRPALLHFWYRQSTAPLLPEPRLNTIPVVTWDNPPRGQPGSAAIVLDGQGRLIALERIPLHRPHADRPLGTPTAEESQWWPLFAAAGLDPAAFHPAPPEWDWQMPSDGRVAWVGVFPERPDLPLRVEAATDRGEAVGFRLVTPWTPPAGAARVSGRTAARDWLDIVLPALLLVVGGVVAVAHLRAGRADQVGAFRLVTVYAGVCLAVVLLAVPHMRDMGREAGLLYGAAGLVLHQAVALGLAYLALEPFVRRRWPGQLVGWVRLLNGRWRDPWVGRDVLLGAAVGAALAAGSEAADSAAGWLGYPPEFPLVFTATLVEQPLLRLLGILQTSIQQGLTFLFVLFLLARVLRTPWLWYPAILVLVLAFYVFVPVVTPLVKAASVLPLVALGCFMLYRFGLLAFVSLLFTYWVLHGMATTYDLHTWYWPATVLALGIAAVLAGYGLVTSVGGWRGLSRPAAADAR
jgi:hypothetical protein